jgi:hypothetical protein
MKILRWLADCTWEAYPNNPEEMLRYACGVFAPWLKPAELEALVAETHMRLKNWNGDDTATVLGVTLADHDRHGFKAIGACNDDGRTVRNERRLEKEAARKRAKRAAAGAKRGRPSSGEPWKDAGVSRRTWFRHKAEGTETGTEKASAQNLKNTSMRTGFSATKSLTPWAALGISRATFYRHKAAGTLPRPAQIDGIGFDPAKFGIVSIRIMSGTEVMKAWERAGPSRRSEAPGGIR